MLQTVINTQTNKDNSKSGDGRVEEFASAVAWW